tara:strand:+ start:858 stop:1862 length:1005 start_codon:yes stop_codon:yes gene_type:complete
MILQILYNKLNKYYNNIVLKDFNYKLTKVKNIKLIDTHFIPDKVRLYIQKNLIYKYNIIYKFKNISINVKYFSKKEVPINTFKIILKRIIFMMIISNTYININIDIYDTPYKKKFNCNNEKKCGKLETNNVNSGLNYSNNIIIFRKEEYLKLLLHELIHALDLDYKYETLQQNKIIFETFNVNSNNLLINESYVETWAIILNTYCVLQEKNINTLDNFKKLLKKELAHSLLQCAKLCVYYNIDDFNKIYLNHKNTIYYKDNVNTFSYHIIKTINLYYLRNYLKNFQSNNCILNKGYNYELYLQFIVKHRCNTKINLIIEKIKNKNLNSLTMSSI